METIQQAITTAMAAPASRPLSSVCGKLKPQELVSLSPATRRTIQQYTTFDEIEQALSPSLQFRIATNGLAAHADGYPTLRQLNAAYGADDGHNLAARWIAKQLGEALTFCGIRMDDNDSVRIMQQRQLAAIMAGDWLDMRTSEVMKFFWQFKSGKYGRFYGKIDPMVVTTAMRTFEGEREQALQALEREQRARRRNADKRASGAVTYREWHAMGGGFTHGGPEKETLVRGLNLPFRGEPWPDENAKTA